MEKRITVAILVIIIMVISNQIIHSQSSGVFIDNKIFFDSSFGEIYISTASGSITHNQIIEIDLLLTNEFTYVPVTNKYNSTITILRKSISSNSTWNALVYPYFNNDTIYHKDHSFRSQIIEPVKKEYKLIVDNVSLPFEFQKYQYFDWKNRYPNTVGRGNKKIAYFYLPNNYGIRLTMTDRKNSFREIYINETDTSYIDNSIYYTDFSELLPINEKLELQTDININDLNVFVCDQKGTKYSLFKSSESYDGSSITLVKPIYSPDRNLEIMYSVDGYQGLELVTFFKEYDLSEEYINLVPDSIPELELENLDGSYNVRSYGHRHSYNFVSSYYARIDDGSSSYDFRNITNKIRLRRDSYYTKVENNYYPIYYSGFSYHVIGDDNLEGEDFQIIDFETILIAKDNRIRKLKYSKDYISRVEWIYDDFNKRRIITKSIRDIN